MKRHLLLFYALAWLAAIIGGSAYLAVYSYTPGEESDAAPKTWPAVSSLPRSRDLPTLVMFAHPKCPCTRASIGELDALMARCQGQLSALVVFFRPDGVTKSWADTDLWRSAAAIPGVTVQSDMDGIQAREFHATTSGHVVLYDVGGKLIFSGGITDARGHSGDNAGRTAIVDLLQHGSVFSRGTPTFGCPLRAPKSQPSVKKDS